MLIKDRLELGAALDTSTLAWQNGINLNGLIVKMIMRYRLNLRLRHHEYQHTHPLGSPCRRWFDIARCANCDRGRPAPAVHLALQGGGQRLSDFSHSGPLGMPNKLLLAFAEGRVANRRGRGNIDIVLRRSLDHGQTWEPLQVVADFGDDFCGNPCIVQDSTNGRLWLAFTRSRGSDPEEDIVSGKCGNSGMDHP